MASTPDTRTALDQADQAIALGRPTGPDDDAEGAELARRVTPAIRDTIDADDGRPLPGPSSIAT